VLVESLKPAVKQAGLSRGQLVTDVELRLRSSGIKVLTETQCHLTPGAPCLYLNVNAIPDGGDFVYSICLELAQRVRLDRSPSAGVFVAPTWHTGEVGPDDVNGIRQAVRDRVDDFANDFLSVNPRK
jgi:hypothetical protein